MPASLRMCRTRSPNLEQRRRLSLCSQEVGVPDINVVCERLTVGGLPTRFEDQARLPVRARLRASLELRSQHMPAEPELQTIDPAPEGEAVPLPLLRPPLSVLCMRPAQMGVSVNSTAYSAKLMTAMAFDPKLIAPMLFGDTDATHAYVQDGAALAGPGEHLNWWQLMVRRRRSCLARLVTGSGRGQM